MTTNNNNLLNDDNNIENCTIPRDKDNKVINTFINSEGRIAGAVEEKLQAAIVQGSPAQGYPPCPNDVNLNLNLNNNGRWRNNATQHIRPNCNNQSNNTSGSIAQRSRWDINLTAANFGQHTNAGNRTKSDSSNFGWGQNRKLKKNNQNYKLNEEQDHQEEVEIEGS